MLLTFSVEKQIILRTDTEKVVTNSMNYLYARFTFSEEWTGEKTAVFTAQKKTYNALLDENNTCLVPWEALTGSIFTVSVFCGDLITANKVIIYTIPSGYEVGDESRIPTPEIYTQVIEKLNEIEQEIDPEAIERTVDAYLADKDFVTEADVETIVSQYVAEHVHGIPTGGTAGQVLVKSSSTDYDTEWGDGGSGSGDMTKSTYDPNGVVEDAGGIEGYVEDSFENLDTNDVSIYTGLTEIFDINHIENPFPPESPFISLVDGVLTMNAPASGNIYPGYQIYDSDLSASHGICTIRFHVVSVSGTWAVIFVFKNTDGGRIYSTRLEITEAGTYDVDLRLDELTIYNRYNGSGINVALENISNSVSIVVDEFSTYIGDATNLTGNTLTENLVDSDTRINALENNNNVVLSSPSGEKFIVQLDSSYQLQLIPVIPNDIVYVGNSLLLGFTTHGMASYDTTDDYYALVNDYIESKGVTLTPHKVSAVMFERAENSTQLNSFLNSLLLPALSSSTKLVIIQAGDNTTTQATRDFFKTSCATLIEFIHTNAPNARIAWVGTWYINSVNETIDSVCKQYGIARIPLSDLSMVDGNMSHIGATYIDANGDEQTITDAGVASHPSPQGMKAIADRIISTLFN